MLTEGFEFSQGSLQDYIDCPRRFQLRYVNRQAWPAVEAEPALEREMYVRNGQRFHQLLERFYAGIPTSVLEDSIDSEVIYRWWQAFLNEPPLNLPDEVLLPEVRISVPLGEHRLMAVFDLLAYEPGRRLVIVDWKTGRFRPERDQMQARLQSVVYPFVAVESSSHLLGEEIDPARVTMVYWFANYPEKPHVFHYSQVAHEAARDRLLGLMDEIAGVRHDREWPLTLDDKQCRFCVFRSLCDRGVIAGDLDESLMVDEGEFSFDLDDVDELAY